MCRFFKPVTLTVIKSKASNLEKQKVKFLITYILNEEVEKRILIIQNDFKK
jgi:hypothetical protein